MNVRFGNLSVNQFQEKCGVKFKQDDLDFMQEHRTDTADVRDAAKFHIFELPMGILCGSEIVHELIKRLRGYEFDVSFYVEEQTS